MTYSTNTDMMDRFGERELLALTDRTDSGALDLAVLERARVDAFGEINGYLAGNYDLPLTTVPAVLTRLEVDIARYRLYDERPTVVVRQRYEDAIAFLKLVADGKVQLGINEETEEEAPLSAHVPKVCAPPRVFSIKKLRDF